MSEDLKTELADKMTDIMMEAMQDMFEDVKTELTEYINKTFSQRIYQGLVYHIFFISLLLLFLISILKKPNLLRQ